MKAKNWGILILILIGITLATIACDKDPIVSPIIDSMSDETIIVENRSGINGIKVFVDNNFKGMVNNNKNLELYGDYAGSRKIYSEAVSGGIKYTWGPNNYNIPENGKLILTLR